MSVQDSRGAPAWLGALFLVFIFEGLTLWLWLGIDTRPPAWDESIHLSVALDYSEAISRGRWQRLLKPAYFNYPPLYHLSLEPALRSGRREHLSGETIVRRAISCNWVYLVFFGLALFFIGAEIAGPAAGFAAGVFGTAAPFVTEVSHSPLIDLALSAWVAWAFYALIRSERFTRWTPTLLFGILCGIGMLTKWSFFVYVGLPASVLAFWALFQRRWAQPLSAFVIFLAIILPWYLHNAIPVITRVIHCAKMGASEGDPAVGSLASWIYYPETAVAQLHAGLAALAILGTIFAFFRKERWILLVWGFIPMALWSLVSNKDFRYSLPCLGALALLAATVIPERPRMLLLYVCAAVLWGQFTHCFGTESRVVHWKGIEIPLWDPHPPQMEDWKQSEIARYCILHRDRTDPLTTVSTVENTPFLHSTTLNLNSRLEGFKSLVFRGKTKRLGELSQFILTKTGDLGPSFSLGQIPAVARFLEHPDPWFQKSYVKARDWPLPDGSRAVLFERKIQPVPIPRVKTLEMDLQKMSFPHVEMEGLFLKLSARSGTFASLGLFRRIEITARTLRFRGFPLENVHLTLEGAQIDWPLFLSTKEVRLMKLERVQVQVLIPRDQLQSFAAGRIRGIKNLAIGFDGGLNIRGSLKNIAFEAGEVVQLHPSGQELSFRLAVLRVMGLPVPLIPTILSPFTDRTVSLTPNSELPFFIDLHSMEWTSDGLRIR
jgi:hypothetical protein